MSSKSCLELLSTLANRAMFLYDNRDPINQGRVFFVVFHFELTPSSDGELPRVSARQTVLNWESIVSSNLLYQL